MKSFILLIFCWTISFSATAEIDNCAIFLPNFITLVQSKSDNKIICVYKNEVGKTTAQIFSGDKGDVYKSIGINGTLLKNQDNKENAAFPSFDLKDNELQLTYENVGQIYGILFDLNKNQVNATKIFRTIYINNSAEGVIKEKINLSASGEALKNIKFDNLKEQDLVNNEKYELSADSVGKVVSVTSEKAMLFDSAVGKSAKMYLIKSDKVKILEYKKNRLKIQYITRKENIIYKWVDIYTLL